MGVIITGPSLDQLDYWGALDGLPFSLDSAVWGTAELFEASGGDVAASSESAASIVVIQSYHNFSGADVAASSESAASNIARIETGSDTATSAETCASTVYRIEAGADAATSSQRAAGERRGYGWAPEDPAAATWEPVPAVPGGWTQTQRTAAQWANREV